MDYLKITKYFLLMRNGISSPILFHIEYFHISVFYFYFALGVFKILEEIRA